jgi:hypothetical protein
MIYECGSPGLPAKRSSPKPRCCGLGRAATRSVTRPRTAIITLARSVQAINAEIAVLDRHIDSLVRATAPGLVAVYGVGADTAAILLVAAGDNATRIHSEAAWAHLCGVAPIPAGSGKTNGRHRLNPGGNRVTGKECPMHRDRADLARPPSPIGTYTGDLGATSRGPGFGGVRSDSTTPDRAGVRRHKTFSVGIR